MKLICTDSGHEYGFVGAHTPLKDDNGNPLRVGDVVLLKSKTSSWSKLRFVAYDNSSNKYYIMGAYFGTEYYNVKLAVAHENLPGGFSIGNVYYKEDVVL